MAKQQVIKQDGIIEEALSNAMFRVRLENDHMPVSYTHLRAHETVLDIVCRLLLEKTKSHDPKTDFTIPNK